jgi:hypothetical protein
MWTFYDFMDVRGVNLIRQWLDGLPKMASAKIDTRLLFMQAIPVWPEQYVSAITGWPQLVEFRVVSGGNQYRPLGFFGPERREFTIVLGAIEKGKLSRRILEAADDNREIVLADRRRICKHEFSKTADAPEPPDGQGV